MRFPFGMENGIAVVILQNISRFTKCTMVLGTTVNTLENRRAKIRAMGEAPLQMRAAKPNEYPAVHATWERADMPETPRSLPCAVQLRIDKELELFIEEERLRRPYQEPVHLIFPRDYVLGANIFLMPDIADDVDWQWINEADLSIAELQLKDPFDVVPHFNCIFTTTKSYWFRLLAKLLKEKLGVEASLVEENKESRKRRLLRANASW